MSDVWKLRKYEAELREETQHVTGHCLNIISACVIARIRKNTKCAIFIRNGEFSVQHGDALERRRRKLVDAADINPVLHDRIPFVSTDGSLVEKAWLKCG